jgi:hypothetical protein
MRKVSRSSIPCKISVFFFFRMGVLSVLDRTKVKAYLSDVNRCAGRKYRWWDTLLQENQNWFVEPVHERNNEVLWVDAAGFPLAVIKRSRDLTTGDSRNREYILDIANRKVLVNTYI